MPITYGTYQEIITLACQIAKVPGMTVQAGQMMNSILRQLSENYNFDIQKVTNFSITTGTTFVNNGAGPYNLPTGYLRNAINEQNYVFNGQPYILQQIPISTWRSYFQSAGIQNLPLQFATDFSTVQTLGFPQTYLWPPPNGAYVIQWPYYQQHVDVQSPESSTAIPWMPDRIYLYTKLAFELMKIANDDRLKEFYEVNKDILTKYLEMKDDVVGYSKQVKLDGRYFKGNYWSLPNTKLIGWAWILPFLMVGLNFSF